MLTYTYHQNQSVMVRQVWQISDHAYINHFKIFKNQLVTLLAS